jgi:hypothetical protein
MDPGSGVGPSERVNFFSVVFTSNFCYNAKKFKRSLTL